jgi:uncharacterized protein YhaN
MFKYIFSMLPAVLMFFDGAGEAAPGGGAAAEPVAEDREDRIARAEEVWKASDTDPAADKAAADKAAADAAAAAGGAGDQGDAEKKAAEDKAAADKAAADAGAGDDAKLPYFNEPRFQEIYKENGERKAQLDEFSKIFTDTGENKLGYTIDSTETLTGVLQDAYTLYDIAGGKKSVAELLTTFEKNWSKEQFQTVLQDMANFAASKGVKIDEKAAAEKPWEAEINKLRNELGETKSAQAAREKKEKQDAEYKTQMETVVAPFEKKVSELCIASGLDSKVDAEEIGDYLNAVSDAIGRDKNAAKIREQIAKGQFGEVERLFTQYHNKLVARAKRLGDTVLKQKIDKEKTIPKVPAGGAGPAPKPKATEKRDLSTADGRLAAAKEEWNKSKTA